MSDETEQQNKEAAMSSEKIEEAVALFNASAAKEQADKNVSASETKTETSDSKTETSDTKTEASEGDPNRPEWLPEKFKEPEQLVKSYQNLEKKLGAFVGAPEEYSFESMTSKGVEPIPKYMDVFVEKAKAAGVNQEFFNDMLADLSTFIIDTSTPKLDPAKEFKKLGENGKEKVDIMSNWVINNFSKEETQTFEDICQSKGAVAINLFNKMRTMMTPSSIPLASKDMPQVTYTKEMLMEEVKKDPKKFWDDENYRKDWRKRLQQIMPD